MTCAARDKDTLFSNTFLVSFAVSAAKSALSIFSAAVFNKAAAVELVFLLASAAVEAPVTCPWLVPNVEVKVLEVMSH